MQDYKKLKIPRNYVLVLPDPEHKTYAFKGEDTEILVGEDYTTAGQRLSVRGKIYVAPKELVFNGFEIRSQLNRFSNDRSSMDAISNLRDNSVGYDVPMEAVEGDIVYFNYLEHYECYQYGRFIETELGDMFLMKYDSLILSHPEGKPEQIKPLNGLIIIEKIEKEKIKSEWLIVPDITVKSNRVEKFSYATIIASGCRCKGYLDEHGISDDIRPLKIGDRIAYKPSGAHLLEHGLHQTLFGGKEVYAIHGKDLLAVIPQEAEVEVG